MLGKVRVPAHLHRWLLLVAGIAGCVLAVIVPPGKPPDEYAHLQRIWTISQGRVLPDVHADGVGGAPVEACITAFSDTVFANYTSVEPRGLRRAWASPMPCRGAGRATAFADFGNTAVNSPVTYAPQVAAVTLLDALGMPVGRMVLGARLAALAAYLAMAATAVKVASRGKVWLVVVGALPAAVGLASTLSSDSMVLGAALLAVGLLIRLREPLPNDDPHVQRRLRGALAVALVALCLVKNAYSPFVLLWLLVPAGGGPESAEAQVAVPGRWRRLLRRVGVPAVGLLASALWALQVSGITKHPPGRVFANVDPPRQLSWVASHPLDAVGVLWHTVASREFFGAVVPRVVGRYASGRPGLDGAIHSPPVAPWILALVLAMGVLAIVVEAGRRRPDAGWLATAVVVAIGLGTSVLAVILVYSVSSPVGWPRVMLVQGRYFTPLLGLAILPVVDRFEPRTELPRFLQPAGWLVVGGSAATLAGCTLAAWTMYFR